MDYLSATISKPSHNSGLVSSSRTKTYGQTRTSFALSMKEGTNWLFLSRDFVLSFSAVSMAVNLQEDIMGKWSDEMWKSHGYTVHKDGVVDPLSAEWKVLRRRTPTLQQIEEQFAHMDTGEGLVKFEIFFTIDKNGEISELSSVREAIHTHKVRVRIETSRSKIDSRDLPSYRQWSSDLYPRSLE